MIRYKRGGDIVKSVISKIPFKLRKNNKFLYNNNTNKCLIK